MIKNLLPKQTVCNQKNEKGETCFGLLKRYYPFASYYNETDATLAAKIKKEVGSDAGLVLLKCELCSTVYRLPEVLERKYAAKQ
ncbi:MAG: hypothetical protein HY645_04570 [Acidobacteria bacterium]|nr:hypothetical protein [Acidobacteriota bacterium]